MSYKPTLADAAVDLYRVVNCSLGEKGLDDGNAKVFLENALTIIKEREAELDSGLAQEIKGSLSKGLDEGLPLPHRQEHLLLAASLLR